jgi:3-hydroxybutyryl-CoA dehydrogenase
VDTNHAVSHSLYDAFYQVSRFRPSRLQQQLVDARQLGKKTGHGFYHYTDQA